jgi:hypothetical protein
MKQEISLEYTDCAKVDYTEEIKRTLTAKSITNHLPALPIELFVQITTWLQHLSIHNNVEGVCSLTVKNGEWVPIIWHQTAHGALNVQYEEDSPENIELVESLDVVDELKKIHCTIHSHNKAPASQSSDDQDDERSKMGWHITVGNCNQSEYSLHARFCVFANAVFKDGVKTAAAHQEFITVDPDIICEEIEHDPLTPSYLLKSTLEVMHASAEWEFPEEWLDRCYKQEPAKYHYNSYHQKKKHTQNGLTQSGMINITDTKPSTVDTLCEYITDECRDIDIYDILKNELDLQYTYGEDIYCHEYKYVANSVKDACENAYASIIKDINAYYPKKKRKKKINALATPSATYQVMCNVVENLTIMPETRHSNDDIIKEVASLINDPWN